MSHLTRRADAPDRSVTEVGAGDYIKIGNRWETITHNTAAGATRTPNEWTVTTDRGRTYGMFSIYRYAKAEDMEDRMIDINKMTPREFCAGLMRGDRTDMKAGYSYQSAALVAAERNNLDEDDVRKLLRYALGFAEGMVHAMHRSDPSNPPGPDPMAALSDDADYVDGRRDGLTEEGFLLYPASIR
jgi:hypothetical protein